MMVSYNCDFIRYCHSYNDDDVELQDDEYGIDDHNDYNGLWIMLPK